MITALMMLMIMKMAKMNDHSDDGDADVYGNDTGHGRGSDDHMGIH